MLRIRSLVPRNHASSLIFEPLALRADVSKIGGDDGNRTHDPLLAGQVLSQLSYTPMGLVFLFGFEQSSKIEQQAIRTSLSLVGSFPLKDTRSYFTLSCVASHSP